MPTTTYSFQLDHLHQCKIKMYRDESKFKNTGKYAIVINPEQTYPNILACTEYDFGFEPKNYRRGLLLLKYDLVEIRQYNARHHSYCVISSSNQLCELDYVIGVEGLKILGEE